MKGTKNMAKSFSLVADKSNNIKAFIFSTNSNAVDEILAIYKEKRKDITVHHSIVDKKTLEFMSKLFKLNEKILKDC